MSCEADSSIAAADALPIGRHIWRYAEGGVWKQSSVRTSRVEQWIVLEKSSCRSGKDSGSAKLGVFQKRKVLDVLGDPVVNRDNVLVVQTITLPQKMSPELGELAAATAPALTVQSGLAQGCDSDDTNWGSSRRRRCRHRSLA